MRAARPQDAVVTGAGCVNALARGTRATLDALGRGETALRPTADALVTGLCATMAPPYLTSDVPEALETQIKFLNDAGELVVEACLEAAAQADLGRSDVPEERRGLYLSQVDGEAWSCHEFRPAVVAANEEFTRPLLDEELNRAAARRVKPFFMLESLKNNAFSFLATLLDLRGPNTSVAGFAGATHTALDMAVRSLVHGRLDVAVVAAAARPTGGVARAEMDLQGVPQAPGDGAAALVLERAADAAAGGRTVRATLLGLGAATHAVPSGSWRPSADALRAAASQALTEAQATAGDIAAVVTPHLGEEGLEATLDALPALAGVARLGFTGALGHCALAQEALQWALAVGLLEQGRLPGGGPCDGAVLVLGAGLLGQAGAVVLG